MSKSANDILRANLLAVIREGKHTVGSIAESSGISQPDLSRFLNGHRGCTVDRAQQLAEAVGMSLSDIFTPPKKSKTIA